MSPPPRTFPTMHNHPLTPGHHYGITTHHNGLDQHIGPLTYEGERGGVLVFRRRDGSEVLVEPGLLVRVDLIC